MSYAGLIDGRNLTYLDHLGPLCAACDMPLIVTHDEVAERATQYYPGLSVIGIHPFEMHERIVRDFDILFHCTLNETIEETFGPMQEYLKKPLQAVWCPHGNSDKGANRFFMEDLKGETAMLVYGQQMIDYLHEKGVWEQVRHHRNSSNYRHQFFQQHAPFYREALHSALGRPLPKAERTLLYAPTWNDSEGTLAGALEDVVAGLPAQHNLIVKLHPNVLVYDDPYLIEYLRNRYADRPNVFFLVDFTPIYALLSIVDAYIGDMSSVGYDFLTFDRPMFFLNPHGIDSKGERRFYLFRCGTEIRPPDYPRIHEIIDEVMRRDQTALSAERKAVYQYTFGPVQPLSQLKHEVRALCQGMLA